MRKLARLPTSSCGFYSYLFLLAPHFCPSPCVTVILHPHHPFRCIPSMRSLPFSSYLCLFALSCFFSAWQRLATSCATLGATRPSTCTTQSSYAYFLSTNSCKFHSTILRPQGDHSEPRHPLTIGLSATCDLQELNFDVMTICNCTSHMNAPGITLYTANIPSCGEKYRPSAICRGDITTGTGINHVIFHRQEAEHVP